MYRNCIERLKSWALRSDRGAMVLRGARQVGKTTLVRLLADDLKLTLVELNMEETQSFIGMLAYKDKAKDVLELILLEQGINKRPEDILFFFDEAQECPGLYAYLRYFKEQAPEYRVVAAGSLFEFEIKSAEVSQGPTGRVEYAYLDPMSFEEFIREINPLAHEKLLSLPLTKPIPNALHTVFTKLFKEYLVCGGMPAAVKAKAKGQGPLRLDEIKSDIVTGYLSDLPKYSVLNKQNYDSKLLERLYINIMGSPANGMKYSELAPGYRAEVVRKHLDVMQNARIIRQSLHTSQNKVPLSVSENKKIYKLFSLDVGLCYTFMELPVTKIYTSEDINDVANGTLAEQFVAQTISSLPPYHKMRRLNHWERQKKSAQSEVDFVIGLEGKVIPVECKSGYSSKMKSLKIMLSEKKYPLAVRLYSGNIQHEKINIKMVNNTEYSASLLSLPHYMLERFAAGIDSLNID